MLDLTPQFGCGFMTALGLEGTEVDKYGYLVIFLRSSRSSSVVSCLNWTCKYPYTLTRKKLVFTQPSTKYHEHADQRPEIYEQGGRRQRRCDRYIPPRMSHSSMTLLETAADRT